jgi:hypothetical protein
MPGQFEFSRILTPTRRAATLLVVVAFAGATCRLHPLDPDPTPALPSVIQECETNTARVCGTWALNPGTSTYSASWVNGSKAIITVVQLDERAVVFTRRDTSGPTSDMIARYVAIPDGKAVQRGQVRWSTGGLTFFGIWDAEW